MLTVENPAQVQSFNPDALWTHGIRMDILRLEKKIDRLIHYGDNVDWLEYEFEKINKKLETYERTETRANRRKKLKSGKLESKSHRGRT